MNLHNINYLDLCIKLLQSESEKEVTQVLQSYGFLKPNGCWRHLGDTPSNFSVAGNQQSMSIAALVEKLVNSSDAVLIDECLARGIDPRSTAAPKTMREAVERFFGVPGGLLQNIDATKRKKLAERIMLVATGNSKDPCYIIVDTGEGQTPDDLPSTILSLPTSNRPPNKTRIPFVQGRFNMGGTGVLRFCGYHNYQLVISRRDPRLLKNGSREKDSLWGFTIIRRKDPSHTSESSIYEYLVPDGQNIPTFNSDSLKAHPGHFPEAYGVPMTHGTCIKLYDYQVRPRGLATNALFDLNFELSTYFQEMPLPIRIVERRSKFKGHTFETTLSGMVVRLNEDRSNVLESNFPNSAKFHVPNVGDIIVMVYAFISGTDQTKWVRDKPIVLTINGQCQGLVPKSFFSRSSIGLDYIADDVLITLDCSTILGRAREDLFMPSRDRLIDGDRKAALLTDLEAFLIEHTGLHELARERREEQIQKSLGDSNSLKQVLDSVIRHNPSLAEIFSFGNALQTPSGFTWEKTPDRPYKGQRYPSFFRLEKGKSEKFCPINSSCTVKYETDVENEYFKRTRHRGYFTLTKQNIPYSINLWNGIGTLTIRPPNNASVGDIINVQTEVGDKTLKYPFKSQLKISIIPPIKKGTGGGGGGGTRQKIGREKILTGEGEGALSGVQIPKIIPVEKDDLNWVNLKFTEMTGLKLRRMDKEFDAFVNMDNIALKKEMQTRRTDPSIVRDQFSTALVICATAIYYAYQERNQKLNDLGNNGKMDEAEIIKIVNDTSDGISLVILPTVYSLTEINRKIQSVIRSSTAD